MNFFIHNLQANCNLIELLDLISLVCFPLNDFFVKITDLVLSCNIFCNISLGFSYVYEIFMYIQLVCIDLTESIHDCIYYQNPGEWVPEPLDAPGLPAQGAILPPYSPGPLRPAMPIALPPACPPGPDPVQFPINDPGLIGKK
jgi:hypothetical protein